MNIEMFNKNQEIMKAEKAIYGQPQDLLFLKSILQDLYSLFGEKLEIIDLPEFKIGEKTCKVVSRKATNSAEILKDMMDQNYSKIYLYTISELKLNNEISYIVRFYGE
jgi:hypothetical protein